MCIIPQHVYLFTISSNDNLRTIVSHTQRSNGFWFSCLSSFIQKNVSEEVGPKHDSEFWSSCLDASSHFFKHCLLPEILGTWFTKKTTTDSTNPQTTKERELSSCSCTVIAKSLRMTVQNGLDVTIPRVPLSGSILHVLILLQLPKGNGIVYHVEILINKNVIQ